MKITNLVKMLAVGVSGALLFACGGGGGSSSSTTVNVVTQAGVFTQGQAVFKGYSGANLDKPYVLNTVTFDASKNGRFSADVGNYKGVLLVEVSGEYSDEATEQTTTVSPSAPMKSAVPSTSVQNGATLVVSPLTDVAAQKAAEAGNDKLTDTLVVQHNQAVSTLFGIQDITTTVPVAPVASDLQVSTIDTQKAYTAALLLMSQYVAEYASAATGKPVSALSAAELSLSLPGAVRALVSGISVNTSAAAPVATITSPSTAFTLQQAQTAMSANTAMADLTAAVGSTNTATVNTAVTTTITNSGSAVQNVKKYTLKTTGTLATGAKITGIQLVLGVPAGSIAVDTAGAPLAGVVTPVGSGFSTPIVVLEELALRLGFLNANGVESGPFATVYATAENAAAFTITGVKIVDAASGALITTLTVVIE